MTTRLTRTLRQMRTRVRQWACGLHGHDRLLHFAGSRVALKCSSCGHETPGWTVTKPKRVRPAKALRLIRGSRGIRVSGSTKCQQKTG